MKVLCLKGGDDLTEGEIYEVLAQDRNLLQLKDDVGDVAWRYVGRFEFIENPVNTDKRIAPKIESVELTR